MGVILFLSAEIFVIVWVALILLVIWDRIFGDRHSTFDGVGADDEIVPKPVPWPAWKSMVLALLGVLVAPLMLVITFVIAAPLVVIAFVIAAPLGAWEAAIYSFYWLRFRTTGKPMPPFGLGPDDFEDPPEAP